MTRDELIEAAYIALEAAALRGADAPPLAGVIVDAVEMLIRADEREQAIAEIQEKHRYEDARRMADLRAQVEALVEYGCPEWCVEEGDDFGRHIRRDQVLALFDGGSDE